MNKLDDDYKKDLIRIMSGRLKEQKVHDIITGHIQIETLLNEIIKLVFPKYKKIIKHEFDFIQKWRIIQALDVIPNKLIRQKIELINNIRNGIAHNLDYQFNKEDIEKLKVNFEKYKSKIKFDQDLVHYNISYILGYLEALIKIIKEKNISFRNKELLKNGHTIRTGFGRKLNKTL